MKSNVELKKDVESGLRWEPSLIDTDIAVDVQNGMVTLTGVVDSIIKKQSAVWAAKQVPGVKAITVKLSVKDMNSASFKEPAFEDSENVILSVDNNSD